MKYTSHVFMMFLKFCNYSLEILIITLSNLYVKAQKGSLQKSLEMDEFSQQEVSGHSLISVLIKQNPNIQIYAKVYLVINFFLHIANQS